jgi:hypothetical protein
MGFSASSGIHGLGINRSVLPIKAFTMNLDHFLPVLRLQLQAHHICDDQY